MRHFASHWVMGNRSLAKLREIMGHSSVTTTERYAHLRPDAYNQHDLAAVSVDLTEGEVVDLPGLKTQASNAPSGHKLGYNPDQQHEKEAVSA